MHAWAFQDAAQQDLQRAGFRLIPCVSSETVGSPALLPLAMEEHLHIKHRLALEHVIDGSSDFMGQDGQRFACAMCFL
jgi:hypothetical protein